jgi:hypothetical protein
MTVCNLLRGCSVEQDNSAAGDCVSTSLHILVLWLQAVPILSECGSAHNSPSGVSCHHFHGKCFWKLCILCFNCLMLWWDFLSAGSLYVMRGVSYRIITIITIIIIITITITITNITIITIITINYTLSAKVWMRILVVMAADLKITILRDVMWCVHC